MASDLDHAFKRIEELAEARALPALDRVTRDGLPALTVRETVFAQLQDRATLVLLCPHDQKSLLMDISPDIYFETESYVGEAAVLIRLEAISDEELALRLEDGWRFRADDDLLAQRPIGTTE